MESAEIARRFLRYFEEHGHQIVPSASLVADDPTVLFVIAGMQPFKPYLLGQQTPPWKRAADVQKCMRTLDIEEVGRTSRHATFFQMLGNWSFGDYFKDMAIPYAWELLTRPERDGGFGFPEDRLWATVLHDDDEAYAIWRDVIKLPESRIQRRGLADNYWHMGVPGPGGPCSEIYYDRGPEYGRDGGPEADEDRYLEVWNLVFMQDQLSAVRSKVDFDIQGPLPFRNVDTGMGLERMAAILQGVDNIYEIDTTYKILDRAAELTDQRYGRDQRADVALKVIADHVRASVMLVEDGVLPSNEGRGYVLRRILRRSIRNLRLLAGGQRGGAGGAASSGRHSGGDERYMHELSSVAIDAMAALYPELRRDAANIQTVIEAEEAAFLGTLRTGTAIFDAAMEETRRKRSSTLSGAQAFQLHDTYGFPIELTLEMAAEQGLSVDEEGFRRLMAEQRDRAKADAAQKKTGNADISVLAELRERAGSVQFTGYDQFAGEATIVGLLVDDLPVAAASAGQAVSVVLDRTPFYAEGGGQLPDWGVIRVSGTGGSPDAEVEVFDVQQPLPGLIVHRGKVRSGEVRVGAPALAEIDMERRRAISRSHTATHLVHRAIRGALGDAAAQAARRTRPAACGSTSPRRVPCRAPCSTTRRTRSTRSSSTTSTCGRSTPPSTRRGPWGRWRCSVRSTATRSAWSRSVTTRASCAAARTWRIRASSAWSRCSTNPRSGRACAGSRRWSASTRSATWPGRTSWSASSASSSRRPGRNCPSESPASSPGSGRPNASSSGSGRPSCSKRPVSWPPARRTSAGRRSSRTGSPTARTPTASASWRSTSGAGCPRSARRWSWSSGCRRTARWSSWPSTRRPATVAWRPAGSSASRRVRSAGAAAANPMSRRAAARRSATGARPS